jgi:glycogen debranching enzyme
MNTITECYDRAVKHLVETNSSTFGLLAAAAGSAEGNKKHYTSLFSRDIGVSSLGILASDDNRLIDILKTSLQSLSKAQSEKGQFPFYYRPEENKIQYWTPGSIDSTLWWCIAFLLYYKKTGDQTFYTTYAANLERGFTWLTYQDTNNDLLLEQGEASDWADEMPRHGSVLYTNTLWYFLIKLRVEAEQKKEYATLLTDVHTAFNTLFWIHKGKSTTLNYIPDNEYTQKNAFANGVIEFVNAHAQFLPYYVSYVAHKSFDLRCDTYGNILACLVGLTNQEQTNHIVDFIFRSGAHLPYPVKAMYPPIYPGEHDWKEYMAKGRQNFPWQYHNGGIWPYIGGFWVLLLAKTGNSHATEELEKLAEANKVNDWEFNEYLHGQLGTPMGIALQTWNMSMYLAAYKAVNGGIFL